MKTNSTLKDVLLALEDFRNKSNITGFTELIECYDQTHKTDTFGQASSLQSEVAKLSKWKKVFSDITHLTEKSKKLEVLCQHYEKLLELLQGFEGLSDIKSKIQSLNQEILNLKKAITGIDSQTSLNELRLRLRRILDTASHFGLSEEDFGLYRKEREMDWSIKDLTATV